jgi:hypothetical protein
MLAISALQIVGLLSWLAVAARIQHADDNMLIYIMTLELSSVLFFFERDNCLRMGIFVARDLLSPPHVFAL